MGTESADGSENAPTYGGLRLRKTASRAEAMQALRDFVISLGVEDPAETEEQLLLQAAPYMSESLEENLRSAWTPAERARLDSQPMPEQLDHRNRDHEYFFFKQMRRSLERRASRSSSFGTHRSDSIDVSRRASPGPEGGPPMSAEEQEAISEVLQARWRAECRRNNLAAVWGEQGRAVLTALDSLPEQDVLLDATPERSPRSSGSSHQQQLLQQQHEAAQEQHQQSQPGSVALSNQKGKQKEKRFFCF